MRFLSLATRSIVVAGVVFGFTACDEPEPTSSPVSPLMATVSGPSLVPCPSGGTAQATSQIFPGGGLATLKHHQVYLPAAAIDATTSITIDVPQSPYLIVDLRANGQEHHQFDAPLLVTIDYSRCSTTAIERGALSVWLVDPATGEMLQEMPTAMDNRLTRTITFVTDHFSGYAIAN